MEDNKVIVVGDTPDIEIAKHLKGIGEEVEIPVHRLCFPLRTTDRLVRDHQGKEYTEKISISGTRYAQDANGTLRRLGTKVSKKAKRRNKTR